MSEANSKPIMDPINIPTSVSSPAAIRSTSTRTEKSTTRRGSLLGYGLAFLFAAAAFFSGMQVGASTDKPMSLGALFAPQPKENVDMSLFWKVWSTLDQRFVSSTTTKPKVDQDRVWSAIQGLVNSYGDPYTIFMPPQNTQLFESDIAGEFGGIGMEVGMKKDVITVIAPLPGSPAEKAGILSGDVLIKIDGVTTEHLSIDEAVLKIRGEKGTDVHLTLYREGAEGLKEVTVKRDTINIPTLKTEEKDDVFVIHLYNFSANSESLMTDALHAFVKSNRRKLVIDLRGNPGGYLQSAVGMASYFLPTGKIVVRENFGPGKEENLYRSAGKDLGNTRPFKLVLLVDNGSASASEILAGALKEQGVATVIGTHTFGKGSVQELIDMPGGSSLKVTIARWLTPNGKSISDGGLAPDIDVKMTQADHDAGKDPQFDAAVTFFKK